MTKKSFLKSRYLTKSPAQTKKVGAALAKRILNLFVQRKKAVVLGLKGDLGGGKTTFLQGFAKGLGIKEKILSPTFVLMKKFKIFSKIYNLQSKIFIHIDCYRIQNPQEILVLDFQKMTSDPKNIIAIEWAERISKILPKDTIWVEFKIADRNQRRITLLSKPITPAKKWIIEKNVLL